jgi:hypothetical protein
MVNFSVYVAAATLIESPEEASAIACPMVLQATDADKQLLLSLPLTPFTYHAVPARDRARTAMSNVAIGLDFPLFVTPSPFDCNSWGRPKTGATILELPVQQAKVNPSGQEC